MEVLSEEAATKEKCLEKIYQRYGKNVHIMRTNQKRETAMFGLIEKHTVQVTFAVSDPSENLEPAGQTKKNADFIDAHIARINRLGNTAEKAFDKNNTAAGAESSGKESSVSAVDKMESLVARLVEHLALKEDSMSGDLKNIKYICSLLEENDFSSFYISKIKKRIFKTLSIEEIGDLNFLRRRVLRWIADSISIKIDIPSLENQIIILVGPTGIGKTTSLAKLAAFYYKQYPKIAGRSLNVQIITIDWFRIGGSFQMQKYCEIMDLPFTLVENPEGLNKYLHLYKESADIICVDTTGRSPNDHQKIGEMAKFFEVLDKDKDKTDVHLAIAAGTRCCDIKEIAEQYRILGYESIFITKFDETAVIGNVISALDELELPVSYVSTGQNVPRDIEKANKKMFLGKLKGFEEDFEYIEETFPGNDYVMW